MEVEGGVLSVKGGKVIPWLLHRRHPWQRARVTRPLSPPPALSGTLPESLLGALRKDVLPYLHSPPMQHAGQGKAQPPIPSSFQTILFSPPIQTKANKTPGLGTVLGTLQVFNQYFFFFKPTPTLTKVSPSAISSVSPDELLGHPGAAGGGECSTLAMHWCPQISEKLISGRSTPVIAVRASI